MSDFHALLDTVLIALILIVDAGLLWIEYKNRRLYQDYFRERARWYAARRKEPLKTNGKKETPDGQPVQSTPASS